MPMSRIVGCSIALVVTACVALRAEPAVAPGVLRVEVQNARFDGRYLEGRVLVGAAGGPVTLHNQPGAQPAVIVKKVLDCVNNEETHWIQGMSSPFSPRLTERLTLSDGEWHGSDVKLLVFAEEINKEPGPDCILATISVWPGAAGNEKPVPGEVVVRVTKTADAGSLPPAPDSNLPVAADAGSLDSGATALPEASEGPDGGIAALPGASGGLDAGSPTFTDDTGKVIPWPHAVQPVAVLDGPAILAAHAALQRVLARFPKNDAQDCAYSAKAMEVMVGQQSGLYFVNVNHKIDRCGWAAPGAILFTDWFELYAVSPDGRVLARYPYYP